MKATVPVPTPEAIAQNKAEQDSRGDIGRFRQLVDNFRRHPDMAKVTKNGDPSMNPPTDYSPVAEVRALETAIKGDSAVNVEAVKAGTGAPPTTNQAPPSSNKTQPANNAQPATNGPAPAPQRVNEIQNSTTDQQNSAQPATDSSQKDQKDSTSEKKKKKGLRKLIPF
jgi:hypothetical protein